MTTSRPVNRPGSALETFFRCVFVIACMLLLASCQKAEIRYAKTLDRNALMALPFPDWAPTGIAKVQTVDLSATTGAGQKEDATAIRAEITPLYVVKLDEQHAALVTQVLRVGENDLPYACHACSGEIGAYFFEQSPNGWRLLSRQDSVASSGAYGQLGKTNVSKLEEGRFAVTSESADCGQGYCSNYLVVISITSKRAVELTPIIRLSADNDGAYGACSALDNPKPVDPDAMEENRECQDIRSKWKFQGKRLLVSFEGRLSQIDKNGERMPTQKIRQQAIYEATPEKLTLISGSNPVPGF